MHTVVFIVRATYSNISSTTRSTLEYVLEYEKRRAQSIIMYGGLQNIKFGDFEPSTPTTVPSKLSKRGQP